MRRASALVALIPVLAAAGACATAAPVAVPDIGVPVPPTWTAAASPAGRITADGWKGFGANGRAAAVEAALTGNFDLQAAAFRLEIAASDARTARAELFPSIDASYTGARQRQNFVGFPIPGAEDEVLSTIFTNHGVSLDVSWEIDLWGRLRAATQVVLADLQASAADLRATQLSMAGQTAKAWFAVAEAQQQIELSRTTVESFRESAERVRGRFEAGIRPPLDLRLALLNLSNAEALLQQRRQQFDSAARQLKVLLGEYADDAIAMPLDLPDLTADVPAGLPAQLVSRRPDLVAAERRLASFEARVGVAQTNRFPNLTLTARGGTATDALKSLVYGDFSVWALLANVTAPIWQGGRLREEVTRAEAQSAEALATFANTALTAYAEVETALAAEAILLEREQQLAASVEHAQGAARLAYERYLTGIDNYITVLESQRSAAQAEGELIAARRLRLENRVDLYLALGGGFEQLRSPVELIAVGDAGDQQ
ncbi:MAG: efflux transporter outer membrane subunit [Acidobacteria bacterium]|nr:efflux transporter outer membrane subunit [Acidobacteriota bacterium]